MASNQLIYENLVKAMNQAKPVHFEWSAEWLINGKTHAIPMFHAKHDNWDLISAAAPDCYAELRVKPTDYANLLVPNKDRLRIKITKRRTDSHGVADTVNPGISQIFVAFLETAKDMKVTSNLRHSDSGGEEDDLVGYIPIYVNIIEEEYYFYRLIEGAGVIRGDQRPSGGVTVEEALKYMLTRSDVYGHTVNATVASPDNTRVYPQMLIPQKPSIRLIDFPEWLQTKKGIYTLGAGAFFHKSMFYVFPLFDYTRFKKSKRTLTVVFLPKDEYPSIDNSYILEGEHVFIFGTGNVEHLDNTERSLNNTGNAYRYVKASQLPMDFYDIVDGKPSIPKGKNAVYTVVKERENGINTYANSDSAITDNPFNEISKISQCLSAALSFRWEAANLDLIYPGIPAKILYKDKGRLVSIMATLTMLKAITTKGTESMSDRRYLTTVELVFSCQTQSESV